MEKLIKVIYLNSDELEPGFRTELNIGQDKLVAIEMYSSGKIRYVVVRDGMVDYILNGGKE